MSDLRSWVVRFHRYLGLALAGFIILAGLTGSLMAFQTELDRWLNPDLFTIEEVGSVPLSVGRLVEEIEQAEPSLVITYVPIVEKASSAIVVYVEASIDPVSGQYFDLSYDELFVNPVTAEIKGRRMWGECCLQRPNLMPFIFKLHNRLQLPKPWGSRIMGTVAFFWLVMALLGIYLTVPKGKPFWRRWSSAWKIRRGGSGSALLLQVHKSFGLWIWIVMLSSSVTALTLSLESELVRPLVKVFSPQTKSALEVYLESTKAVDTSQQSISYGEAMRVANIYAHNAGLSQLPSTISYSSGDNIFAVDFGDKFKPGLGPTEIFLSGDDGKLISVVEPGAGSSGDWFMAVRYPLHSGQIAGFAGRLVLSVAGIMLATITATGCVLWVKRRSRNQKVPVSQ